LGLAGGLPRHRIGCAAVELAAGLPLGAQRLDQPIFTPSTKAAIGAHDENISLARMREAHRPRPASAAALVSLELYTEAADYALTRGIIIADTKFEFGLDRAGDSWC
jgi:phosphoribosylaminoimidazole-succinocarboxamide synthase